VDHCAARRGVLSPAPLVAQLAVTSVEAQASAQPSVRASALRAGLPNGIIRIIGILIGACAGDLAIKIKGHSLLMADSGARGIIADGSQFGNGRQVGSGTT